MLPDALSHDELRRYLRLLGVPPEPPGTDALRRLVRAHLARVPFENVSKLHRFRQEGLAGPPAPADYLDGIERHGFGGTCYTVNGYLALLLAGLGYPARLCGADMDEPDVHVVVMLELGDRAWLVDAGYGAPFTAPLPRDLDADHVVAWGDERYVLKPADAAGRSRLEHWRAGRLHHGYLAKPAPRRPADFARAVADSYRPGATFLGRIMAARYGPDDAVVVRDRLLVEGTAGRVRARPLPDDDALAEALAARFGMARDTVRGVLAGMPRPGGGVGGSGGSALG